MRLREQEITDSPLKFKYAVLKRRHRDLNPTSSQIRGKCAALVSSII